MIPPDYVWQGGIALAGLIGAVHALEKIVALRRSNGNGRAVDLLQRIEVTLAKQSEQHERMISLLDRGSCPYADRRSQDSRS